MLHFLKAASDLLIDIDTHMDEDMLNEVYG